MTILLALPLLICPVIAGNLVQRGVSARNVLAASLILLLAGDSVLALIGPAMPSLWFAVTIALIGAGTGLCAGLADGQALSVVPLEQSGMAAGFLNTLRLGSETIAIAFYSALLVTRLGDIMETGPLHFVGNSHHAINDIATGNVAAALQLAPPGQLNLFHGWVVSSFHLAFQQVMGVLTLICLVLGVCIMCLLRETPEPSLEVQTRD